MGAFNTQDSEENPVVMRDDEEFEAMVDKYSPKNRTSGSKSSTKKRKKGKKSSPFKPPEEHSSEEELDQLEPIRKRSYDELKGDPFDEDMEEEPNYKFGGG